MLIFLLCVLFQLQQHRQGVIASPIPRRFLVIGEKMDMMAVDDYCAALKGTFFSEKSQQATTLGDGHDRFKSFASIVQQHGMKHASWDLRICELVAFADDSQYIDSRHSHSNASIAFISHKFGVKPYPPWHLSHLATAGSKAHGKETLPHMLVGASVTPRTVFLSQQLAGIKLLMRAMGIGDDARSSGEVGGDSGSGGSGFIDGVLLSGCFSDLAHPDIDGVRTNDPGKWLLGWSKNMSSLMLAVQEVLPKTTYFAVHTCLDFAPFQNCTSLSNPHHCQQTHRAEEASWRTEKALALQRQMNAMLVAIAEDNSFATVDLSIVANVSGANSSTKGRSTCRTDIVSAVSSTMLPLTCVHGMHAMQRVALISEFVGKTIGALSSSKKRVASAKV